MTPEKELKRISKFLSFVLRHQPAFIGLELDANGWANVQELLAKMKSHGYEVSNELLEHVVSTNNKKRFAFDESNTMIRASQGHSIEVELELQETAPPEILYHGTAEKNIASILETGLQKLDRNHVHLSSDIVTAKAVGGRHGKPRIFTVSAAQMRQQGFVFYLSENKVWLTEGVPPQFLTLIEA